MWIQWLLLGVGSVVVSYSGVVGLRRWAQRRLLDVPNERSSHSQPTPRGGGLVIVAATLVGLPVCLIVGFGHIPAVFFAYLLGATLIAAVSWIDDLHSLPNRVRFALHSLGAIIAIWGIGYWLSATLPGLGLIELGWLGLPVTFVWIAGLTNAYNFMDGIDGIAGGQAVVAGFGWVALGWWSQQLPVAALGLLVAASSLGFLGHNWPPARIFMGDVGSAFLGYTFAVLPLILSALMGAPDGSERIPLASVLLVWPFVFDTAFTFLRRLRNGEKVFSAHRSHL